jgi:hypothetical protein
MVWDKRCGCIAVSNTGNCHLPSKDIIFKSLSIQKWVRSEKGGKRSIEEEREMAEWGDTEKSTHIIITVSEINAKLTHKEMKIVRL